MDEAAPPLRYLPTHEKPTALYRLYDAEDELLYVGISTNPKTRWAAHAAEKPWWPQVARKTTEWHGNREIALDAEREAIRSEHPQFNVVNHPVNWPAALERGRRNAETSRRRTRAAKHFLGIKGHPKPDQLLAIYRLLRLTRPMQRPKPEQERTAA